MFLLLVVAGHLTGSIEQVQEWLVAMGASRVPPLGVLVEAQFPLAEGAEEVDPRPAGEQKARQGSAIWFRNFPLLQMLLSFRIKQSP